MRILNIRLQNLNSLKGTWEVNLERGPLADAGLFAITGPTGAGKSTILDAVTLALYGRAARYQNATAEEMMSRGAGECYASVDFESAGDCYTVSWHCRRARGKADGKFQPFRHELSQDGRILEDKTRAVVTRVGSISGLDYDRFLRSVLLAQGQFAAFLAADRDKRADLLERITGAHVYSDLGALAWRIHAERTAAIRLATARLEGVQLLTEEQRAEIGEQIAVIEGQTAELEARCGRLSELVETGRRIAELETLALKNAEAADVHAGREHAFIPEAERLARHDRTLPFAEGLANWQNGVRAAERAAAEAQGVEAKRMTARAAAERAGGAVLAAIQTGEAAGEAEVRELAERQTAAEKRLAAGEAWLKEHAADEALTEFLPELSGLVTKAGECNKGLTAAEKRLAEARKLWAEAQQREAAAASGGQAAEEAAAQAQTLLKERARSLAALLVAPWTSLEVLEGALTAERQRTDCLQRLAQLWPVLEADGMALDKTLAEATAAAAAAGEADQAAAQSRERLEAAQREEALLRELVHREEIIRSLEEHRAHLVTGEACPLCGATEHPWATEGAAMPVSSKARLREQQTAVKRLETDYRTTAQNQAAQAQRQGALRAKADQMAEACRKQRAQMNTEWAVLFPESECTAAALEDAVAAGVSGLERMQALALTVRAAAGGEEAARKAAVAAAGALETARVKLAETRRAAQQAEAAVTAADAETGAARVLAAEQAKLVEAALTARGEAGASLPEESLARLQKRERLWRNAEKAAGELREELAALGRQSEKAAQRRDEWRLRRAAAEESLAAESLEALPCSVPPPWEVVVVEWTGALKALQTAVVQADAARARATKGEKEAAAAETALTEALRGSAFEGGIAALQAARLETETLRFLTGQRDALKEEKVRLESEKTTLARQRAEQEERLNRLRTAPWPQDGDAAGLPVAGEVERWQGMLDDVMQRTNGLRSGLGALRQQLSADDNSRAKHAAEAAQVETMKTEAAPWARLSGLIGSATGDRFSRYAQSITLDHLTALANGRLAQLCDRYRLLRSGPPEEMQLQIADAWQADTLRPVESLSGGETFLISLALALGLSELAGRRARIGTLFIDEGFGTLDAVSLDIALSALEGLRTGHRTIGIISHVEALKARLTTRLEVTRGRGGWSSLEVRQ